MKETYKALFLIGLSIEFICIGIIIRNVYKEYAIDNYTKTEHIVPLSIQEHIERHFTGGSKGTAPIGHDRRYVEIRTNDDRVFQINEWIEDYYNLDTSMVHPQDSIIVKYLETPDYGNLVCSFTSTGKLRTSFDFAGTECVNSITNDRYMPLAIAFILPFAFFWIKFKNNEVA